MTNQDNRSKDAADDPSAGSGQDLRQKAEALARERAARTPEDGKALSPEEIRKTIHELRVHQIELEIQNEELRTAQAQIEAGRDRYFDLYDLAPVGYCTLSKQGVILEANLTAATLLGRAHGGLIKQPISRFILKEDQDIYYLHRKKLLETAELQECDLRLVKPDGVRFWAHLKGTVAQADDGSPLCRVVLSDITERKQAEEALRASEARFRHLFQSVPNIAVQGYGPNGTTRYWNEASEHLYGYTAQEAIGRNFIDLIIPTEMRGEVEQAIQQMAETGQQIPASEMSLLRKDGSRVSVFSSHATLQIPGQAPELFCMDIDITERKRAEDKLRDSELFFHTTINSLKGHICVLDETGKIVLTNQAWDDFAIANSADPQCVSEGVNYLSVCDSVTGPDLEMAGSCSRGIRAVLSGDSPQFSMEYPCHSPTEKRWFLGNVSPLQKKDSRWAVISHENITERKQAEEKMAEHLHELQRWYDVMLDREGRVIKLKREVNELLVRAGEPPRYSSAAAGGPDGMPGDSPPLKD
jgi:PAS domain S-box-containing protein